MNYVIFHLSSHQEASNQAALYLFPPSDNECNFASLSYNTILSISYLYHLVQFINFIPYTVKYFYTLSNAC